MTKPEINRIISGESFHIYEEKDTYQIKFMHEIHYEITPQKKPEQEVYHLYGVAFKSPFDIQTIYVLAESEKDAISQAGCSYFKNKSEHYMVDSERVEYAKENHITISVQNLPFLIRGWGKQEF